MSKTSLLYVTFARDLGWMEYSLQSVSKYVTGLSEIVIVVPTIDIKAFLPLERRFSTPECPVWIKNFLEYPGKGFVHHLAMKCYADAFCPESDYVLFMDPDCLFSAPVDAADYRVGEKPILVIEPYDVLRTVHPARYNWKGVTELALGFDCPYETMCRHPANHLSLAFKAMREHIERQHRTPFIDFVLKQKNSYPQGFGEFNTIGAYVHRFMPDKYHFIDRGTRGDRADPPSKVWQGWSYTGAKSKDNWAKIQQILGC